MLVFRGLGTRTKHSGSNTSSCGTTQWSTCHGGNSSSVCTCHGTPAPPAAAAAAAAALVCSSRDEVGAFCWHEISPPAGSQLPSIKVKITVACRCPTQAFKIISSLKITGEIESSSSIHIWDEEELGITVTRCICPLWW